jgi:hypothetical protein
VDAAYKCRALALLFLVLPYPAVGAAVRSGPSLTPSHASRYLEEWVTTGVLALLAFGEHIGIVA